MKKSKTSENEGGRMEVPIWVAVSGPQITIGFHENDTLGATLEQTNSNTYDRLKLCRSTLGIDGEMEIMRQIKAAVIVTFSGALLYPQVRGITREKIVDATNKINLKLLFGGIAMDAIAPDDIGMGVIYHTGYFMTTGGGSGQNYHLLMSLQQCIASPFDRTCLIETRFVTAARYIEALSEGSGVSARIPSLNATLLLNGITFFKRLEWASGLVFLWSSIESLIDRIWADRVVPSGQGIVGRAGFVEGNQWQAAYKVEVIFQLGAINEELYSKLNIARLARNKLAHKGVAPSHHECEVALECTFRIISLIMTNYCETSKYDKIWKDIQIVHRPTRNLNPRFWHPILPVPGSEAWGDQEFPRYREIELVPTRTKTS